MKRILIFSLILMFGFYSLAFAAPSAEDIKSLNEQFQDARYRIESGVNYNEFSKITSDLSVATHKFDNKFQDEKITKEFIKVYALYSATKHFWGRGIYDRLNFASSSDPWRLTVEKSFPDIAQKINDQEKGDWHPSLMYGILYTGIPDYQNKLDKYISDNYPQ